MINYINITGHGIIVNGNNGDIHLPFKEHEKLLKEIESFFEILLSLELDELRFKNLACLNCGFCCKYFSPIEIKHEEILRLARFFDITVKEFKDKYTALHTGWPNGGRVIKDVEEEGSKLTRCIFLKKEPDSEIYICSVHPARPRACRNYEPSSVFLSCRNLWKSKWEKINNVILLPGGMIVYVANEITSMEPVRIKYRDIPVVMTSVSKIRDYAQKFIPSVSPVNNFSQTDGFSCIKCGNCCIFRENISLTEEDIKNLSEFLKITEEDLIKIHTDIFTDWEGEKIKLRKRPGVDMYQWCNFLEKTHDGQFKCQVYPVRPVACRQFIAGTEKRFCTACKSLGVDYT